MRPIRQALTKLTTAARLTFAIGLALTILLAVAPGTRAAGYSIFESVSEFFGWGSAQNITVAPSKQFVGADPRDNIFLAGNAYSPYTFAMPAYNTPGVAITENFNGLGSSGTAALPADWRFGSTSAYSAGASNATLAAGTSGTGALSSASAGGYYNLASGVTATSPDRAPGWLASSSFTSPRQLFVKLTNNTGAVIGSADIAYDIEKYRSGTRAFTINFFTSADGTTWTAQSAGDQSYNANGTNNVVNPPTTINKSFTVNGLSIPNGGDLYLRWSYTGSGGSTNAQGLGIDNFSFTSYQASPGTLQFAASASNVDENLLTGNVQVSRAGGSLGAVSVDYAVTGGTATGGAVCTAGVDYVLAPGTLVWADLDAADKFIPIGLCTDLITYEGPETVQLALSNAQGGALLGGQTSHTLTINDVGARFFNTDPITINGGPASPYPSDITVAGMPGAITELKVTLQNVTHTFPDDIDVLLVGPGGQKFVLMSDIGGDPNITNRVYTFGDSAASFMQDASNNASGTYKPTNYDAGQQDDAFDPPAPASPYLSPGPAGADTLASVFADTDPNGAWSLYVRDAFLAGDNGVINAGWNMEIKTTPPTPGTLQFQPVVFTGGEGATATITARRVGGSLGAASVDYGTGGGSAAGGAACGAGVDFVNASGTLSWADGEAGTKSFSVQLCSDTALAESAESVDLTLSNPVGAPIGGTNPATLNIINSEIGGAIFANHGAIAIPVGGNSTPYPSTIAVSGVGASVTDMRLSLNGFSHTFTSDVVMMLVGPGGRQYVFFAGIGGGNPASDVNLQIYDGAPGTLSSDPIASGAYPPTNLGVGAFPPPPAPQGPYFNAAPSGTDTFSSTFGGTDPNGVWSLYVYDQATPDSGSLAGGWDLQVLTGAAPVGTVEFTSATFNSSEGSPATITASRVGGTAGAISVDYATANGSAAGGAACGAEVDYLDASGTLSWASGEGGTKSFNVPTCADTETAEPGETVTLALSNPGGTTITGTNPATLTIVNDAFGGVNFSNPASIAIPDSGAASPYPSDIVVSGLGGTLSDIRVKLNNFSHTYPGDVDFLLVGPQGQAFSMVSKVGRGNSVNNVSLTITDSASSLLPDDAPFGTGTYKPTTNFPGVSLPPPAPGGPYFTSAPAGTDTLLGVLGGIDPNGTWSLYAYDNAGGDQGVLAGGWELDIQTSAPTPGTVQFSAAAYNGMEGSLATVTAKRVGGNLGPISVDYATGGGSATGGAACGAGVDYVNTSGTLSWADGDSAQKTFTVSLCPDALLAEPTETVDLTLSNPVGTSVTGANPATLNIENNSFDGTTFSNPASISIPAFGAANPYPSTIEVSGMTGAVTEVRMVLKNFSHTYTSDADILLVGPGGQKFVVMSDVGSNTGSTNLTLSLYDAAAANMTAAALASGPYKPTDIAGVPDNWPGPAPSGPYNHPAPWGGTTFASVFNGSNPNGPWSLYVYDPISPDGGSIAGGWELQIASAETVRFDPGNYTPAENAGTVSLQVVRPSSDYTASVDYTLGSAGALYPAVGGASCAGGVDYIDAPGTLSFGIGELTKNIDIALCDDGVFDGLKIILPELSNPTGGMILGSPSVATVFINDDETPPTLSIGDVTVNEADGTATFLVTQSFTTNTLTQFLYSTSDGSALAGFDYTGATNAIGQIPAGSTTTNIVVPILQDGGFEETETFSVALTNIINANAADPVGVGTITDDDAAASYTVTSTNNVNDGSCNATHCSLREAINASNAVPGIIGFAPGLTGTITFSGSRPQITNNTVINGPGADVLAVSGNNIVTVFDIPNAGTAVTLRGLTIRNGFNLDFAAGGAITNNALLLVENSVITASRGNFAGAIQTFAPMTIRNSTLSNNVGGNDGMQPGCSSIGGAIDSSNDVTINIVNSTITGNSVSTNCSANAGAINLFAGRVVVTNSTITNNTGSNFSGAIDGGSSLTSVIRNSIIAGNTGDPAGPDVNDTIIESGGFNIIGNPGEITAFNQPTDQTGTTGSPLSPGLGALANNGGSTPTHALLAGSPAIDKGNSFGSATDQRGIARPFDDPDTANAAGGDGSDIGAYEAIVPAISVTGGPLAFGNVLVGGFSAEQTYTVSGANLSGNVIVTAPTDFHVSTTSGSGFGPSVTLTPSSGTLSGTTIYVRFAPSSAGLKNGNVTNESAGAATKNVAVGGTGALAGTVRFASAAFGDSETNGDHTFDVTVSRTDGSLGAASVDYSVADGSAAAADNDYTISPTTGTLNWADGDTADKNIAITIRGDLKFETDETIDIGLSNATGASLGSPASAVLTITNDDPQPSISVGDVTFSGADSLVPAGFTVSLSNPSSQVISVHYQTANDTAVAGEDYTAASGTLTFAPGEASKTIPVAILPDTTQEAAEQFFMDLDNPVGATITDGHAVGTIPNDDAAPTFSIDNVTQGEGTGGFTTFVFFVTKTGPTALPSSIDYTTQPGTATAGAACGGGVDYETRSGTLNFAAGDTSQMVLVNVCGDTTVEPDETFTVHLSGPVNGSISDADGLGTIQNDTTPAVQFQSAAYMEDESQTAVITLIRTGDTSGSSTVSFATSNGTGMGGSCSAQGVDFAQTSGTVTFAPAETTQTVNVPVCMDTLFETTFETANLTLSSPVGPAVLGERSTAVLNLNDTAAQYKSLAPITIADGGIANPYPSTIAVSGAPSVSGTMRITLFDLAHSRPEDLDILLVAPNGQSIVLMADAGGTNALTGNGVTLTFDDAAGAVLPDSALIVTRKYEPTTWGPVAPFVSPAPPGPYPMPGSTLGGSINLNSVFGTVHPNGDWKLFIRDQNGIPPLGAGQIAAGWGLQFLAPTEANASISGRVTTAGGNGIRNAIVKLTGGSLTEPRIVATGSLGIYQFEGLPVGQTYVVQVSAKRFRFAQPSLIFTLQDNVTNIDFVANPQE